jgi:hypothetical protein
MKIFTKFIPILCFLLIIIGGDAFAQINSVGSFEGDLPSYWTKGSEPGGATLTWATDESRSMGRSLKISKSATSDSAAWISENATDVWSPQHLKDVDIHIGAYVKTMNVNTNPATDAERWYISYTFWNETGGLIGETKLPIDQSVANSSGFVADTNGVGQTILPEDSWTTIIKFVGGKDATGTVWADDFIFDGRGDAWAGQNWNTSVGVPTGWNYWLPPIGGNDGRLSNGFENTIVTDEEAYTGLHSLKFDLPFDREPHDAWVGTRRYLLNSENGTATTSFDAALLNDISTLSNVSGGDVLRISMWVKASNLVPDSAAAYPGTWSVGVTPIFHSGYLNNDPYDEIGGNDWVFTFPSVTEFDWTQFYVDVTVPADVNVKSLSVRPHVYSRFTGTVYYDALEVKVLDITDVDNDIEVSIPVAYELANNYPNPFNPTTNIRFAIPETGNVKLSIYNMLGQKIATLVNENRNAGRYEITWNGKDDSGKAVGSGMYFYRLKAENVVLIKKMVLLK